MRLPLPEAQYLLRGVFSRETSFTPDKWTAENPSYGHCAIAVLVLQDVLGGRIRRALLPPEWAERLGYRSHYWNELAVPGDERLAGANAVDVTRQQFPDDFPYSDFVAGLIGDASDNNDKRDYLLSNAETKKRYEILKERFERNLFSHPLFLDRKFQLCWEKAFAGGSHCPKMRFCCLVYKGEEFLFARVNANMAEQFGKPRFCSFDGSECERLKIQSRMDATIGDCGHAPIWSLATCFELGFKPSDLPELDFYEAGFKPDGSPWWRSEPSYSCTYCENMFAIFGLDKIHGAFGGKWEPLWTKDSFYSSGAYAQGKKKA